MPKLQAVLDEAAHSSLDDSLKTLYVQNTETKEFHLDIAPDEAAKLAHNLRSQFENKKTALDDLHKSKKTIDDELKAFKALGKTADEIKAALEANRPEEVTKLIEKYEAEKTALQKSFEEPLTKAQGQVKSLTEKYQQMMTANAIAKVREQFDLNEMADYVLRDYIRAVPKEEGSDEYVVRVFENGEPAMVAAQPMTTDQLIKGFQDGKKFPAMFNAGQGAGTGMGKAAGGTGSGTVIQVSREASKTNPQLYQQAKEQAAKVGGTVAFTD